MAVGTFHLEGYLSFYCPHPQLVFIFALLILCLSCLLSTPAPHPHALLPKLFQNGILLNPWSSGSGPPWMLLKGGSSGVPQDILIQSHCGVPGIWMVNKPHNH